MRCGAVIVETREGVDLPRVIERHMVKLPPDWGVTVFTNARHERLVQERFPEARLVDLGIFRFGVRRYNLLLTSLTFWQGLPYEKVLIFQHDSRLLRSGIDAFLEWDYVGAPWHAPEPGGNGGLSLRTNAVMQAVIKRERYNPIYHGAEDVYFSYGVPEVGGRLAPREVCSAFACESIYRLGTLGCHDIEGHLSPHEVASILDQYGNGAEHRGEWIRLGRFT